MVAGWQAAHIALVLGEAEEITAWSAGSTPVRPWRNFNYARETNEKCAIDAA